MRSDAVSPSMQQRSLSWDGKFSSFGLVTVIYALDKSAVVETSRGKSENSRNYNYVIIIDLHKHTQVERVKEREREDDALSSA